MQRIYIWSVGDRVLDFAIDGIRLLRLRGNKRKQDEK
jgi:hypothetical protein